MSNTLEAQFIRREVRDDGHVYHIIVPTLAEADGIMLLCPACFLANQGPIGTHRVICWFRGRVPDDAVPGPGRWDITGSDLFDLTLTPSIQLHSACNWHGFITKGKIIFA